MEKRHPYSTLVVICITSSWELTANCKAGFPSGDKTAHEGSQCPLSSGQARDEPACPCCGKARGSLWEDSHEGDRCWLRLANCGKCEIKASVSSFLGFLINISPLKSQATVGKATTPGLTLLYNITKHQVSFLLLQNMVNTPVKGKVAISVLLS